MNQAQSPSKLVTWAGVLGLISLLALPLGVILARAGMWQPGLGLYALGCALAAVLLALLFILLLLPGFKAHRGAIIKRGLLVLPGFILMATVFAGQGDSPAIHDISTDTLDPPVFFAAGKIRGEDANPLTIKPDSIAAQIKAYPGLATLRSEHSLAQSFDKAVATANGLGWEIYHQDRDSGTIEAVDTTAIMNFKDDIVIRLREDGTETLVDLRSVSRVGVGDMGANAKRIRSFAQLFQS